ncbi:MAG: SUMF1/EgtB/PvdO family nonheme iron enzyme, partial [Myxococcales bacterium]|nr:SUMF1/EgtB/PvdO family nonheme iron enzyme [Myxococcales bacterium]
GKHLPTEAQYEKAARGPDGDDTPYGKGEVTCDQAVVMNAEGVRSCGVDKAPPHPEKGRTFEVAQKPAGRYGAHDLVGNAEEWVYDWFSKDYEACGADCLGTDPRGPCGGADDCAGHTLKMVKGGSWYWEPMHATGWHRRPHVPNNHPYHHFGFRCAASLEEGAALTAPPPEPEPAEEPTTSP